jgi:hypothetical protein
MIPNVTPNLVYFFAKKNCHAINRQEPVHHLIRTGNRLTSMTLITNYSMPDFLIIFIKKINMHKSIFYSLLFCFSILFLTCKKKTTPTNNNNTPCTKVIVNISTDITGPTTWEDCHVYVISVNQISVTSSLTIQPGAIIKFKNNVSDNAILVSNSGQINAVGTVDKPIIFTSYSDDANGGDNNSDGNLTTPARGDWGGIIINSNNCVFK